MNERIKQLIQEATGYKISVYEVDGVRTYGEREEYFDKEKFAELIVQECTKAVMDGTKEGDHYAMRIENHFDNGTGGILHFGVEE